METSPSQTSWIEGALTVIDMLPLQTDVFLACGSFSLRVISCFRRHQGRSKTFEWKSTVCLRRHLRYLGDFTRTHEPQVNRVLQHVGDVIGCQQTLRAGIDITESSEIRSR